MFTGIIEHCGQVRSVARAEGGKRLTIDPTPALNELKSGESIAVEGVCLTVEPGSTAESLEFFLLEETLSKTTLGSLEQGEKVNLERSLAVGDRMGGHFVLGHVDGVGTIERLERRGEAWDLEIAVPEGLIAYLAPKGSVSVDGISLTIVEQKPSSFTVAIIPHTHEVTSLASRGPGSKVNLEVDMLARYAVHYMRLEREGGGLDADLLRQAGFS